MLEDLRGILLVSRLIILVGSGSPMGPKQTMPDWFSSGMIALPLRFCKMKAEIRNVTEGIRRRMGAKMQMEERDVSLGSRRWKPLPEGEFLDLDP